jgi:Tubulin-tyrosine ligase family
LQYATLLEEEKVFASNRTVLIDQWVELFNLSTTVSPMYKWLPTIDTGTGTILPQTQSCWTKSTFLDYCKVNVGPWDDCLLQHLDDKVLLHNLLVPSSASATLAIGGRGESTTTNRFWPQGVVVSLREHPSLFNLNTTRTRDTPMWIAKERAGYGSHGNTLVRASWETVQALGHSPAACDDQHDLLLLQQMVQRPLLVQGRTFSLRVYVILVSQDIPCRCHPTLHGTQSPLPCSPFRAYIATEGLVKMASVPLIATKSDGSQATNKDLVEFDGCDEDDIDPRMYLTNSGREEGMNQATFQYLRQQMSDSAFQTIWTSVVSAVSIVMARYSTMIEETFRAPSPVAKLRLPKILGFDFVVDQSRQAWLVEVNRFPGLEPRNDDDDALVKHQIVRDAWWVAAAAASGHSALEIRNLLGRRNKPTDARYLVPWLERDFDDMTCLDKSTIMLEELDDSREYGTPR